MIKVFDYMEHDLDLIRFNHWCRILKNTKCLRNMKEYLREAHSYTLYDERPIAILAFHKYNDGMYDGCIIADEDFGKNPKYAIRMKKLIEQVVKHFNMKRVQTTSEDSPVLDKWHTFLGFKLEKKDALIKRGIHYNLWGMQWD